MPSIRERFRRRAGRTGTVPFVADRPVRAGRQRRSRLGALFHHRPRRQDLLWTDHLSPGFLGTAHRHCRSDRALRRRSGGRARRRGQRPLRVGRRAGNPRRKIRLRLRCERVAEFWSRIPICILVLQRKDLSDLPQVAALRGPGGGETGTGVYKNLAGQRVLVVIPAHPEHRMDGAGGAPAAGGLCAAADFARPHRRDPAGCVHPGGRRRRAARTARGRADRGAAPRGGAAGGGRSGRSSRT